jgi:hypothetical protein
MIELMQLVPSIEKVSQYMEKDHQAVESLLLRLNTHRKNLLTTFFSISGEEK